MEHLCSVTLQTCIGHVDGTGTLQNTIWEWLKLLAAACYSWLYEEGEGDINMSSPPSTPTLIDYYLCYLCVMQGLSTCINLIIISAEVHCLKD